MQSEKLVIGVTSSALFDMSESDQVYTSQGVQAYAAYQIERESEILPKGEAFALVKKLLSLNCVGNEWVEVILLSRNSADTGLRVFNSIAHYGLQISRAAFCSGRSPYHYAKPFGCHLLLSTNAEDVERALASQVAAALILSSTKDAKQGSAEVRIAFDGDAVIFSDESERIFKQSGLDAFVEHERREAHSPMKKGPFKDFLMALHRLQQHFPEASCPIRTALVTARSAPAHERVIRTLRSWGVRIDEAAFLGGMSKGEFLKAFNADIFFDDQQQHCDSARAHVATGHVPYGVANNSSSDAAQTETNAVEKAMMAQYH